MKKRIRKKRSSKLIQEYTPYFENMFMPIIEIMENIDPSEFRTHELKMRESLEKQFQNAESNKLLESFIKLFSELDLFSFDKSVNKQLRIKIAERRKNDLVFNELYHLTNEIEKIYPNVSFVIFFRDNPFENFVKAFEPYDLIQEFEKSKGEKAAKTVVRIYREIAEMLYDNYVRAVCEFTELLEGKKLIKSYGSFGVLVNQLPNRLKKFGYTKLVTEDAGWIRNATCHGRWKYDPAKDKIILWDKNKPEREFSSRELFEKSMAMYHTVIESYLNLVMVYLEKKMANECLSFLKFAQKCIKESTNNNPEILKSIELRIENLFSSVIGLQFVRVK